MALFRARARSFLAHTSTQRVEQQLAASCLSPQDPSHCIRFAWKTSAQEVRTPKKPAAFFFALKKVVRLNICEHPFERSRSVLVSTCELAARTHPHKRAALNKVFVYLHVCLVSLCACVQRVCLRGYVFVSEFCVLKKKMTERACILCVQGDGMPGTSMPVRIFV
jgi:hypothetical protein